MRDGNERINHIKQKIKKGRSRQVTENEKDFIREIVRNSDKEYIWRRNVLKALKCYIQMEKSPVTFIEEEDLEILFNNNVQLYKNSQLLRNIAERSTELFHDGEGRHVKNLRDIIENRKNKIRTIPNYYKIIKIFDQRGVADPPIDVIEDSFELYYQKERINQDVSKMMKYLTEEYSTEYQLYKKKYLCPLIEKEYFSVFNSTAIVLDRLAREENKDQMVKEVLDHYIENGDPEMVSSSSKSETIVELYNDLHSHSIKSAISAQAISK